MSENMLKNVLALIPKLKELNSENTNSEGIDSGKAESKKATFDFDAQDSRKLWKGSRKLGSIKAVMARTT